MSKALTKLEDVVLVNPTSWSKKDGWAFLNYLDTANITEGQIDQIVTFDTQTDKIPSRARRTVQEGDMIYSTVRPNQKHYGLMKNVRDNLVVSTGFTVLRSKFPERLDTRYLYLLLTQDFLTDYLHGIAENNTSAYPSLRPKDLTDLEFEIPPIEVQRSVADSVEHLDDKIELNRKMNETLEEIAKAIFKSWFVDFDPVRAKMEGRPTGLPDDIAALFPDRLVDSEIGEIPEGWDLCALREFTTLTKGRSYKSAELSASETALVTLKSFQRGGGYRFDGLKPYTGTYKPEQTVEQGDLIVALTDVTQAADVIGKPAIVRSSADHSTLVASLDVGVVRMSEGSVLSKEFCYYLMLSPRYTSHSLGYTSGTTVLHLAKDALGSFEFAVPSSELIKYFTDITSKLLGRTFIAETESVLLADLRDTLLPKLISGELQVPDAEQFLEEAGI